MGISFNILWVDDNFASVDKVVEQVRALLTEKGFKANIDKVDNAEQLLDTDKVNNYDLLLCDLNLSNRSNGKDLVDNIRDNEIFTETILYSGNADELFKEMHSYAESGDLPPERMSFCAGVDYLWDKAKNVILAMIKKTQDIRQVRGRIISEVVRIEHGLERVLFDFIKGLEESKREQFLNKYKNKIIAFGQKSVRNAEKIEPNCEAFMESTLVTSGNVIIMLKSILTHLGEELSTKKEVADSFINKLIYVQENVISVRNNFAHLVEQCNGDGCIYFVNHKRGGVEDIFDEERFIKIRKDILDNQCIVSDLGFFLSEL